MPMTQAIPSFNVVEPESGSNEVPDNYTHRASSGRHLTPHDVPSTFARQTGLWEDPVLPDIDSFLEVERLDFPRDLRTFFKDNAVSDKDNAASPGAPSITFWPSKLVNHIFQRRTVRKLLEYWKYPEYIQNQGDEVPDKLMGSESGEGGYRKILALLLMVEKEECLQDFVSHEINDDTLPLGKDNKVFNEKHYWKEVEKEGFIDTYQWKLLVPFFKDGPNGEICHIECDRRTIKPWSKIKKLEKSQQTSMSGASGTVSRIILHPWQHGFRDSYHKSSPAHNKFALKRLYTSDKGQFQKEIAMLRRFGGKHEHIVTLLATMSCQDIEGEINYLLFPCADMDLLDYWEGQKKPRRDIDHFRWIADQCLGIVSAVAFIHEPGALNANNEEMFGRHGDIKPENVLYFDSGDGMGNLILSDLGLAAEHRDTSRSKVPGDTTPGTPNSRPPECDMAFDEETQHGHVSRAYDIWTLGCLFLEFMIWTLNGWEGRQQFRKTRVDSPYFKDYKTDVYFKIEADTEDPGTGKFMLKDQVIECFDKLRGHSDCTQFIHEILDIIQDDMLCIQRQARIDAKKLKAKFRDIQARCVAEEYCLLRCRYKGPEQRQRQSVNAKLSHIVLKK